MMSACTAWGMYPQIKCNRFIFKNINILKEVISKQQNFIPFGNGRSYGDSALNFNIIDVRPQNFFLDFDENSGLLHVQAGVLLSEILEYFVPRGWFLRITPGTKFITVGGAIASDVHGKNHHLEGCFSSSVKEFTLLQGQDRVVVCSPRATPELWKATCGGMGLTGIILDAKIFLKRINSQYISQTTIKTNNLKETFDVFEQYANIPYSVAWIDCLARGKKLGRGIVNLGDFKNDGRLDYSPPRIKNIPFNFPSFFLNRFSVRAFNSLYYGKVRDDVSKQIVSLESFFYPLDALGSWNRIYGKKGFVQYQFIIPKKYGYSAMEEVLSKIAKSGKGSFLAVLKLYGKPNDNWLSFPLEGYSLALDFKIESGLFDLLDSLDKIVLRYGGRIYLTKDARMCRDTFEMGYPHVVRFRRFRKENELDIKFQSLQSRRLEI